MGTSVIVQTIKLKNKPLDRFFPMVGGGEEPSKMLKILHYQRQEHDYYHRVPDGRSKVQANRQDGI